MFADTIHDAMQTILEDLKPDCAKREIYDSASVIKMITHMRYLILLSDTNLVHCPTEAEKYVYFDVARTEAIEIYESRMNKDVEEAVDDELIEVSKTVKKKRWVRLVGGCG